LSLTVTNVHVMFMACQYLLCEVWDIVGGVYERTWSRVLWNTLRYCWRCLWTDMVPCIPVYTQELYSSLYKSAACIFTLEEGLKRDRACTSETLVTVRIWEATCTK